MKKQRGFTLIELMVVMAIIAILATAGLSAYTGYIKKARDATRIADVAAMNTIVLASLSTNGSPPTSVEFVDLVTSMNNGKMIEAPLNGLGNCKNGSGNPTDCAYYYYTETNGYTSDTCTDGYMIVTFFESESNQSLLKQTPGSTDLNDKSYWVGDCTNYVGA